jgi:hypothetical protein
MRSLGIIKDNDLYMKLSDGKAELFIKSGKKPVYTVELTRETGLKEPVIVQFKGGEKELLHLRDLQSAAIDSSSNQRLEKLIKGNLDAPIRSILDARTMSGKEIILPNKAVGAVKQGMSVISRPFRAIKEYNKYDDPDTYLAEMKPMIDMTKGIQEQGGKISPQQEIFKQMEDLKGINFMKNRDLSVEDSEAMRAVREKYATSEIKKRLENGEYSETAEKIMDNVKKMASLSEEKGKKSFATTAEEEAYKKRRAERQKAKAEMLKIFRKRLDEILEEDKLSDADKEVLAYWSASSREANIAEHPSWRNDPNSKLVHRMNQLISLDDDIATLYYKTFEETQGTDLPAYIKKNKTQ